MEDDPKKLVRSCHLVYLMTQEEVETTIIMLAPNTRFMDFQLETSGGEIMWVLQGPTPICTKSSLLSFKVCNFVHSLYETHK